jgi:hypothetical protein
LKRSEVSSSVPMVRNCESDRIFTFKELREERRKPENNPVLFDTVRSQEGGSFRIHGFWSKTLFLRQVPLPLQN